MTGVNWRAHAACRDEDPEMFFPVGEGATANYQAEAAREVCAGCQVRDQCADWALDNPPLAQHGMWGGLTEGERRSMLRREARIRSATEVAPEPEPVAKPEPRPKARRAECGTKSGYTRHHREGSPYCEPCRRANREADRRLRATGTSVAVAS